MNYLMLLLKSPFFALKWAILLPTIIVVMLIDGFTSGGCSAFLNNLGKNAASPKTDPRSRRTHDAGDEDSDNSPFHSYQRDSSDTGLADDSGPAFNIDGSPMLGDTDIHGNTFGTSGGFDDGCCAFDDSSTIFDDHSSLFDDSFSSCGSSCFGD